MTSNHATPTSAFTSDAQIAQAGLAVLAELAASLAGSQKALLKLDIAAVEHGTREQTRLGRALSALLLTGKRTAKFDRQRGKDRSLGLPAAAPELAELRAAANHVLHLSRVQNALLARAQRALRIRTNRAAGLGSTYGPFTARQAAMARWPGRE